MSVTKYVCARGMGDQISRGKKFEICFHVNSRTGLLINNAIHLYQYEFFYYLNWFNQGWQLDIK
jgi:hypothetical protein